MIVGCINKMNLASFRLLFSSVSFDLPSLHVFFFSILSFFRSDVICLSFVFLLTVHVPFSNHINSL